MQLQPFHHDLDSAIDGLIEATRAEARGGVVRWRLVLFTKDTAGWRTIVIDPGERADLDGALVWAANRMARILCADAAAYTDEKLDGGGVVWLERRGADAVEEYFLGRGDEPVQARPLIGGYDLFDIVQGARPDEGLAWQDHDSIDLE